MKRAWAVTAVLLSFAPIPDGLGEQQFAASLPADVKTVWEINKAHRESTSTRERICLNSLWRWQPAEVDAERVPSGSWGFFKVPGSWPGITDYMQKDSQTVFRHPEWQDRNLGSIHAAWYEREFTVPAEWVGRAVALNVEYLNSYAAVFVDGKKAGELRFPAGELDLTSLCKPGATHRLSVLVVAMPLKAVALSFTDSASAREVKGSVARRGFCGDVYLVGRPSGPRIVAVNTAASVRQREFTIGAALQNLAAGAHYSLRARIMDGARAIHEFTSRGFVASELAGGRIAFTEKWLGDQLWDLHTPQNIYRVELSLLGADGKPLDVHWRARCAFREFWIEGRDFFLNGTRLHLSAVPLDNAQVGAALSTYSAARESLERLKSFGINFVYTHNYDCEPGAHLSFSEILRAADDVGMLVALTQPHFSNYDWKAADADEQNGYALHAGFYARIAQEHPSVVMYAMSHNATGYEEDMNPDMIDGVQAPRDAWSGRNAAVAVRAEAIVNRLDPSRIVYHHASGNLGAMHAVNFYPNFVPIQEMSDWFGHWAMKGVKPVFLCEYGAPFTWDWTMYRGWYKGEREFGSAKVPWEFCMAEWNAQFFGDRAYAISEAEKANLRWEAKQFRAGNLWHRWDYPNEVSSPRFAERYPVLAMYLIDNWRAFRTWGVSAVSPWEYGHYWKVRDGVNRTREKLKVDWEHLQRPGFSPDYSEQRYERMDLAFRRDDWIATPAGEALLRNNGPLLAYIAGGGAHFTSKDHNFIPDETVEKQIIVINDSRAPITCESQWSVNLATPAAGRMSVTVEAGQQQRIPLRFDLPAALVPGRYQVRASFSFGNGERQADAFSINVLPRPPSLALDARIALFDPKGETQALLTLLGVETQPIEATADLSAYTMLIVGKGALTVDGPAPDLTRVRDGLKVVLFEQSAEFLQKRLGFRVQEYGLRTVFPRLPDHPALTGLAPENLRDWRGAATMVPPRLNYQLRPRYGPTVQWSGLAVPRLWRCGNRGSVASVLIEKPAWGDFLSWLDGGYALQYSTLLEHREGKGVVLFCQMDVTGRTERDPAAEMLARNLLSHVANWKPVPRCQAVYSGELPGKDYFEKAGIPMRSYDGGKLSLDEVLVVGPGGGISLAGRTANVADWLAAGGNLMAIAIDQRDADVLLPFPIGLKSGEHIAAFFEAPGHRTLLAGIGPADVHNRDPRDLPLIVTGAQLLGDGVVAKAERANVIFCQLVPWRFEASRQPNLKRTHRRAAALVSRLLANLGVAKPTPVLERFHQPPATDGADAEQRWLSGLYADRPEEWDDPYRFFRW